MGFQTSQTTYKPTTFSIMWGMSVQAVADVAMVLGLANRSSTPETLDRTFSLNATPGSGLYMYWASPVSAGLPQFLDVDSSFIGGWDGANNDPYNIYGPITLDIPTPTGEVVPYYVFRTDYNDLGLVNWQTSLAV